MQRFAAVWHASPQKMVGILFALLLAAMMAVGSGANFNSTSANPGNMVTAGNLLAHQPQARAARPDGRQDQAGRVRDRHGRRSTNTGDIDGVFSIARTITADPTAPAPSNPFAAHLNLKIEDITTGATPLYNGLLSDDERGANGADVIAASDTTTRSPTFARQVANDGAPQRRRQRLQGRRGRARLRLGGRQQLGPRGGRTPCPGPSPAGSPPWRPAGWGVSSSLAGVLALCATFLPSLLFGYQRYVLVGPLDGADDPQGVAGVRRDRPRRRACAGAT